MQKKHIHYFWLILATYGVWFAIFSGLEELNTGKWWKIVLSLILGVITYYIIEKKLNK